MKLISFIGAICSFILLIVIWTKYDWSLALFLTILFFGLIQEHNLIAKEFNKIKK